MIRILLLCPNANDATSYYRAIGPFTRLQKDNPDIAVYTSNEVDLKNNWAVLATADVVLLQRPFHPIHRQQAEAVRRAGIPLWIDYDDDHFSLAFENPHYDTFMNTEAWKNVEECCRMADVITVSTPTLKEIYGQYNRNVKVIRNAIDDRVYSTRPTTPRTKTVLWRGAQGHGRDLDSVADALVRISHDQALDDWTFHFVGDRPWRLLEKMRDSHTHWSAGEPTMVYFEKLWQTRPSIVVCPLVNDKFNRAKSNITALEAFYAGAVPLVPDYLPEFNLPGVWSYGQRSFEDELRALMSHTPLESFVSAGWDHAVQQLSLTKTNKARLEVLKELLGLPKGIRWEKM